MLLSIGRSLANRNFNRPILCTFAVQIHSMTIHREGIKTIVITAILFGVINIVSFALLSSGYPWLSWCIFLVTIVAWLFIISFFRVPSRKLIEGERSVICPADGKVVVIEEVYDEEYFREKRLQISIFMSPANVHVNRNPVSGEVVYSQYHKGKYLVAWHPESSTENERHSVVIKNQYAEVLVKQIAGAVGARGAAGGEAGDAARRTEHRRVALALAVLAQQGSQPAEQHAGVAGRRRAEVAGGSRRWFIALRCGSGSAGG